jgi:hypothetical protein
MKPLNSDLRSRELLISKLAPCFDVMEYQSFFSSDTGLCFANSQIAITPICFKYENMGS